MTVKHLEKPSYQWTRDESKERFPDSLSPLGWSVLQSALEVNLDSIKQEFHLKKLEGSQVTRWVDGFLYSSKNFFKRIPFYHFAVYPVAAGLGRILIYFFTTLLDIERREKFRIRFLRRVYQNELQNKIAAIIRQWQSELPAHLEYFENNKKKSQNWSPCQLDFTELLNDVEQAGIAYNRLDFSIYFYKNILKFFIESLNDIQDPTRISTLASQSSFQIGRYIQLQVATANGFGNLPEAEDWLINKLGHLSLSWDISKPTYSEQPRLIQNLLAEHNQLKNKLSGNAESTYSRSDVEIQFVQLVACDEEHRFYASYQFPLVRKLLLAIAGQWKEKNLISNSDDIFFLTLTELKEWHSKLVKNLSIDKAHVHAIVFIRKSYLRNKAVDGLNSDQMTLREELFYTSALNELVDSLSDFNGSGIGVSSGVSKGTAFWVTDYDSLTHFPEGAVVLCETPSPTFHSAFLKACAIVSETGGLLSHGAIVARELGIPCLLQVPDLKKIKNGDLIQVDATQGIVKRLA